MCLSSDLSDRGVSKEVCDCDIQVLLVYRGFSLYSIRSVNSVSDDISKDIRRRGTGLGEL